MKLPRSLPKIRILVDSEGLHQTELTTHNKWRHNVAPHIGDRAATMLMAGILKMNSSPMAYCSYRCMQNFIPVFQLLQALFYLKMIRQMRLL
jgi:hypothetical protein